MDDTATPPTACGLIIALPMDLTAVEAALAGGAYTDYVGRGALWGSATELWTNSFRAVAETARSVADDAARRGVRVFTNGTLTELGELFQDRQIVTVVAHWRGAEISKEDISADTATLVERMCDASNSIAARLRDGLPIDWLARLESAVSESARRSRLAEMLNSRMSQSPALEEPPPGTEWHMDQVTLRHENRATLEGWWGTAIRPGNKLELADGLHSISVLADIVPTHWSGVADFSNCQSAQLINDLKQGRSDRTVLANEGETNPQRRLLLLSVIYDELGRTQANYVALRLGMARRLIQQGPHECSERRP